MKKRIYYLFMLCLCAQSAFAWHNYIPMVSEGKQWNFIVNSEDLQFDAQYLIKGDTVINGTEYKRLLFSVDNSPSEYVAAIREQDKCVFICYKGFAAEGLLYDFSQGITKNEIVVLDGCHYITHCVNNILIGNREARLLKVYPTFDMDEVSPIAGLGYFLEGVGNVMGNKDPFYPFFYFNTVAYREFEMELTSCVEGESLLFSSDSFRCYEECESTGDINGDMTVDVSDVNGVVSMILKCNTSPLWDECEANFGKNDLDISCTNTITNIILQKKQQ